MAIIHNLLDPTNNLSGYDPVDGISDGTTIGKSYIMWKMWAGMSTFNTNFKLITNSSPTPTFLQGATAGLVAEPAQSRSTASDVIRFYDTTDPGLSQATPCAFIHEIAMYSTSNYFYYGFYKKLYHLMSGGSVVDSGITNANWCAGTQTSAEQHIYQLNGAYGTTTTMADIPKIVFWKSSNVFMMYGINKADNTQRGAMVLSSGAMNYTAYRHAVGLCTMGLNFNASFGVGGLSSSNPGLYFYDAFSNTLAVNLVGSGLSSNITPVCSAGVMNTAIMNWDSADHLLSGKLRFGAFSDTALHIFKALSDEIEGIKILNSGQAGIGTYGTIQIFEGKYYLNYGNISDGRVAQRMIFELQAV